MEVKILSAKLRKKLANAENRRLLLNVVGSYAIKGGSMVVSLLIMPAYLAYFGSQEILGVWFTIVALLNWALLFDFGIGGGIRNRIVRPISEGDREGVARLLTVGYYSVTAIAILLAVAAWPIVNALDWCFLLGVDSSAISKGTLNIAIYIVLIGLFLRLLTVLICHVLYALQDSVTPSLLILLSNVLVLIYMLVAEGGADENGLISLAIVTSIANNIPGILATLVVFRKRFPYVKLLPRYYDWALARSVMGLGGRLFYLQLLIAFVFNVKEILISFFLGPAQVVDYQIYYKTCGIVGGLFVLALGPIWSAVTKAVVERHYARVRKLYKMGTIAVLVVGVCQIALVPLVPSFVKIWLGDGTIDISFGCCFVFCVYNVFYMWTMLNYNFACGLQRTDVAAATLTIAAILNVALVWMGCEWLDTWALVIAATSISILPACLMIPKQIIGTIGGLSGLSQAKREGDEKAAKHA